MAAEGSTKAVVTALLANLGIAVTTKFVAALLTASAGMAVVIGWRGTQLPGC